VEEDAVIERAEHDPGTDALADAWQLLSECEEELDDADRDVLDAADGLVDAVDSWPGLLDRFPACSALDVLLDAIRLRRAAIEEYDAAELAAHGPVEPAPPGPTIFTYR